MKRNIDVSTGLLLVGALVGIAVLQGVVRTSSRSLGLTAGQAVLLAAATTAGLREMQRRW